MPIVIRKPPPKLVYGAFHDVNDVRQLIGIYDTVDDAERVARTYRTGYIDFVYVNDPPIELYPYGEFLYSVIGQFHVPENLDVIQIDPGKDGRPPSDPFTLKTMLDDYWEVFVWARNATDAREQALSVMEDQYYNSATN
jgi:hypothetical protein